MKLGRRAFIGGAAAATASATLPSAFERLAKAQAGAPPKRLLVIHFPNGTVTPFWTPTGTERDFQLGPILAPFEDLKSKMVVIDGIDVVKKRMVNQEHGNGMTGVMTGGAPVGPQGANLPSIDQVLLGLSPELADVPFRSVQLAADVRTEIPEQLFLRILSYADRLVPLPPEHRPYVTYQRILGSLLPGGATPENQAALAAARARKQSVLDLVQSDLARLHERVPVDQRPKLDSHLEGIRELERSLDAAALVDPSCDPGTVPSSFADADIDHAAIGAAQLGILRTAMQCDLTRVATFMWAPGGSLVNFSRMGLPVEPTTHHLITHIGVNKDHDETLISTWYSEQTAAFIRSLDETPEGDGTMLDNTIVVYLSEVATGLHTFRDMPVAIFGGGGAIEGGRFLSYPRRSINDVWVSVAQALGIEMESFGDAERNFGALPGLVTG